MFRGGVDRTDTQRDWSDRKKTWQSTVCYTEIFVCLSINFDIIHIENLSSSAKELETHVFFHLLDNRIVLYLYHSDIT